MIKRSKKVHKQKVRKRDKRCRVGRGDKRSKERWRIGTKGSEEGSTRKKIGMRGMRGMNRGRSCSWGGCGCAGWKYGSKCMLLLRYGRDLVGVKLRAMLKC